MPQVSILGINVDFPFEPYDVQTTYMEKVLQAIQTSKNAVLESPTGTGKTLCLLCSTLAWVEARKAQLHAFMINSQNEVEHLDFSSSLPNKLQAGTGIGWGDENHAAIPKIIYSSRTHTQLSQAVQELKRSNYKYVKATVVGSRDQLCIHPEVSKETNTAAKIHQCRAKINARTCHYHNGMEAALGVLRSGKTPVVDIEDLIQMGNTNRCCPYYLSRNLKQDADIIFMPYNYLLDSTARKAHGIDLSGNIVIFDEAHNVEKICEESVSFELSSKDVAFCISEVSQIMEELAYIESSKGQSFDMTNIDRGTSINFTLNDLVILKTLFCELETELDKVPLGSNNNATFPGQYIFEFLAKVELTVDKKDVILDLLERLLLYATDKSSNPMAKRFVGLQKFSDLIKTIFCLDKSNNLSCYKAASSYKVHIGLSEQKTNNSRNDFWTSTNKSLKQARTLSYWCFNPGVGMQNLMEDSPRCLLLTSGTLSPLDTFTHELQIPLPIRLENPHIIKKKQLWVGVIATGPDGTSLNSSFQNRSNAKYIAALGSTIVNFSRVVPEGLLVFFPSYTVMNECQRAWEQSNVWSSIAKHKTLYLESKIKKDFQESIAAFYSTNQDKSSHGAAFLAVCRGKVSEGLDFSDHNGRAVIVTGLPYPPWKDPKVELKMQYLNEQMKQTRMGSNGQTWYSLEASRAVNQAIGRVIRHKDDYGAIILCDSRFGEKKFQSQLSLWMRPHIQTSTNFGSSIRSLTQFFKEIRLEIEPQANQRLNESMKVALHQALTVDSPSDIERRDIPLVIDPRDKLPTRGTFEWLKVHMKQVAMFAANTPKPVPHARDLFGALDEHASQQNQIAATSKHTLQPEAQVSEVTGTYQDLTPITTKKRKYNVLGPREAFEKKLRDLGASCVMAPIPTEPIPSGSAKEPDRGSAQQRDLCNFLLDVKKYTTPEQYDAFKTAIKKYSKDRDVEVLVAAFSSFCNNPDIFNRIKVFRNFVFKQHRMQYDEYLKDLGKQI